MVKNSFFLVTIMKFSYFSQSKTIQEVIFIVLKYGKHVASEIAIYRKFYSEEIGSTIYVNGSKEEFLNLISHVKNARIIQRDKMQTSTYGKEMSQKDIDALELAYQLTQKICFRCRCLYKGTDDNI